MARALDGRYAGHLERAGPVKPDTKAWQGEGGATPALLSLAAGSRLQCVTDAIGAGSILIAAGAHLPDSILRRLDTHSCGWSAVTGGRSAFEEQVEKAGLTFFFMAGEIQATVFDFDRQKALRGALRSLIANVKSQRCNSIEITRITGKS